MNHIMQVCLTRQLESCDDLLIHWLIVMGYQTPAGGTAVSPSAVGRALYSFSVQKMSQMGSSAAVRKVLPLLLQAGCLADNHALHMSSVLYSSGLGVHKNPIKVFYSFFLFYSSRGCFSLPGINMFSLFPCFCVGHRPGCLPCWLHKGTIGWRFSILVMSISGGCMVCPKTQIWLMHIMQILLNRRL